jgi:hypothetical protein
MMVGFWSAGLGASAIPDSAIGHWTHSEGSGTELADSIGTNPGAINGASWASGTWVDGYALDYGGGSHDVTFDADSNIGVGQDFSVGLTIQTGSDVSGDQRLWSNVNGFSNRVAFQINSGELRASIWNGSTWDNAAASGPVSTNMTYRIFYIVSSGSGTLYLNNSEQTGSSTANAGSDTGMILGQQTGGGSAFGGLTDDLLIMHQPEDASTVASDYDRQPWS